MIAPCLSLSNEKKTTKEARFWNRAVMPPSTKNKQYLLLFHRQEKKKKKTEIERRMFVCLGDCCKFIAKLVCPLVLLQNQTSVMH